MKVEALRKSFLEFFNQRAHKTVPSSPLVPQDDDTLLFVNAGMVPFKSIFLGKQAPPAPCATSAQCCVRAGGKHNDLENVGYTARHHTFFEMLGNFSFGDYFKKEAIAFAWEYLTVELKIPQEKLWISVFEDDREAEAIWLKDIKIDPKRFSRCGAESNFWSMGETGPCGPCTEIFYDHGESIPGGPPGSPDEDGDRYVEIWNLVFMQFNRLPDGTLEPLPKPSVDTGMGIERIAAVVQGVHSNYEIDLFKTLIDHAASLLKIKDTGQKSLRVLADHIRSSSFLIADGVLPSNEGRGYVLRRIIRRALRHGHQLGASEPFFYRMVQPLVTLMGDAYPHLKKQAKQLEKILLKEEEQFERTLDQGLKVLEQELKALKGNDIAGELAFKLYDTYGFPIDLTADIAREKGFTVDVEGFEREMTRQRERARQSSQFGVDYSQRIEIDKKSEFTGYDGLVGEATVEGLFDAKQSEITTLKKGESGQVVLSQTPFYAESGGQVGDKGLLKGKKGLFRVEDTQKWGEAIVHCGVLEEGEIQMGEQLTANVDPELRQATRLNHSATHLLHAALREILGTHVVQKGSLVAPDRLRFDFSHFEPLTREEIAAIERRVNEKILENTEAKVSVMTPEEAIKTGALALFGEKYGDKVRVLNMAQGYSVELCGGTHVDRTGDIGLFKITTEVGIAAGVRRLEALTGMGAIDYLNSMDQQLSESSQLLKTDKKAVSGKIASLLEQLKTLEKERSRLKAQLATQSGGDLSQDAIELGDIKLLVKTLPGADPKIMRELIDNLKNKWKKAIIVLATVNEQKVQLIVGVTPSCTEKISAGKLINHVASQVGGKGGGRPELAQAGGTEPENLENALNGVAAWVKERL